MLKQTCLIAAVIGIAGAATSSSRQVPYPSMNPCLQGGCLSPVFDKGYFFQMKDTPGAPPNGYALWDAEGKPVYEIDIVAPDGTPGHLNQDAAIDTDGTAIVPLTYGGYGGNGPVKGGGIVVVDPHGKQTQFIATDHWLPRHVCFAPDHSIWAAGALLVGERESRNDYQMVRKYTRDGKLAGEFLPRSSFPPGLTPIDSGEIRAAGDRISILTHPGMVATESEWVELDFAGNLLGRWKLGPDHVSQISSRGVPVLTADGRLVVQSYTAASRSYQLLIFDRLTSSWNPTTIAAIPGAHAYLVGAQGASLAFESRDAGVLLTWVPLTP